MMGGTRHVLLLADGHLSNVPVNSVYSSVILLCGLRTVVFLAELNDLEMWATDIGNTYLEAEMAEPIYIIASPEFEDHIFVIHKALYGLQTSGLHWHEQFADCHDLWASFHS